MAFQFAGVDLGITDEEGNPFTSAVLNTVGWTPAPEAAAKKPAGKNQALALDILKRLEAGARENRGNDGRVSLDWWRDECKAAGLDRTQFWYAKSGLEKSGIIQIKDGFVCCSGVGLGVRIRGLLYSPPNPTNAPTPVTPVGNSTFLTVSNASNGQPDIPDGIDPEEYRECYNTAYSAFIGEGLPPDEADRKVQEEIRKFIAGYAPPRSGAAVSSPATPGEEIEF
jgi:hypothetical protein